MPYTIKTNNKGKFCVHKKNADDSVGEKLPGKCHDTKDDAVAQIGAIESSEKEQTGKKSMSEATAMNIYINPYNTGNTGVNNSGSVDYPDVVTTTTTDGTTWTELQTTPLITEKKNEEEDMTDSIDTDKGMSLDQLRWKIVEAWEDAHGRLGFWVREIYHDDGFIVVHDSGGNDDYKVVFSMSDDGVEFAQKTEWIEVELPSDWVEKSLRDRLDFEKSIQPDTPNEDAIDLRYAVKSLGKNRLGGYGILWGDEENKDLHQEFFTPETKDVRAIFDAMGKVPLIVHHAADDEVKTFVYGEVDIMEEDDTGLWWEAKIKEFEVYQEYVAPLLARRAMFSSSGTLPAAKRRTKSGQITRWPVAEMTTTWIPAEWRMLERPIDEIKAAYKAIDLNCDLSEYDEDTEPDTKGAGKARLKALVEHHISELELLEIEI